MSQIKDLKNRGDNNFNLVDIFSHLYPTGKTKYIEHVLRLFKEKLRDNGVSIDDTELTSIYVMALRKRFPGLDEEYFSSLTPVEIFLTLRLVDSIGSDGNEIWNKYQKFIDFSEKNQIDEKDIFVYKNFDSITTAVTNAETNEYEKSLETQVVKIFDDNEWLVIRPLTYESSKKYGSNTKWCTASEKERSPFKDYSRGILIYCINRKTGVKVGAHKKLKGDEEISFWNQLDKQVDALQTTLSNDVLALIRQEFEGNRPNSSFLTLDQVEQEYASGLSKTPPLPFSGLLENIVESMGRMDETMAGEEVDNNDEEGELEEDSDEGPGNVDDRMIEWITGPNSYERNSQPRSLSEMVKMAVENGRIIGKIRG